VTALVVVRRSSVTSSVLPVKVLRLLPVVPLSVALVYLVLHLVALVSPALVLPLVLAVLTACQIKVVLSINSLLLGCVA
jgi:hypothetical protein